MSSKQGTSTVKSTWYAPSHVSGTDKLQAVRDERINKLKLEARDHIRSLNDYEPFTHQYIIQMESITQIGNVAKLPLKLPMSTQTNTQNNNNSSTCKVLVYGKKSAGTLWDQSHDELILRIIMEEGKLNLLIRILYKFKQLQYQHTDLYQHHVQKWAKSSPSYDISTCYNKCIQYESALNTVIKLSLLHVEAVQVIDMNQYIALINDVLQYCIQQRNIYALNISDVQNREQYTSMDTLTEHTVINYIYALLKSLDDINESAVFDMLHEHSIIIKLIQTINSNYLLYSLPTLTLICHTFNALCHSDMYNTQSNQYIGDAAEQQRLFLTMKYIFVDELLTRYNLIKKRDIIHFYDQLLKCERKYGKSTVVPLPHTTTHITAAHHSTTSNHKTSIAG